MNMNRFTSKDFGKKMKYWRTQKQLTQSVLAEELGITSSFCSAIEMGKRPPSVRILNKLIAILKLKKSEAQELHRIAADASIQIRINTHNAEPDARSMALSFARRFDSLDAYQVAKLKAILED